MIVFTLQFMASVETCTLTKYQQSQTYGHTTVKTGWLH